MFIGSLLLLILFMFGCYRAYKNTHQLEFNRVDLSIEKHDTTEMNILHISDMHLENISITPDYLYETLKDEKIDLIALTGDFLDRKRTLVKLPSYLEVFQRLQPTIGIFAVYGNHDYVLKGKHFEKLEATLRAYDCIPLRNENLTLHHNGHPIQLIGVDDYSTRKSDIGASFNALPANDYRLVLTHDPNIVLEMENIRFDYLLSGHFHGGQIHWPKPYHLLKMGKLVRLNMVKGLHQLKGNTFYISEGLGQTGLNIRIGSRPEITMHTVNLEKVETQPHQAS